MAESDDYDSAASDAMDLSDGDSPTFAEAVIVNTGAGSGAGEKRKLAEENGLINGQHNDGTPSKRLRLDSGNDAMQVTVAAKNPQQYLTVGLWQRVFTYCTPASLFRCLRVCKTFKILLESTRAGHQKGRYIQPIDSEAIWIHVRRTTYPSIPRPLQGLNEAQMLRLITRQTCQNCHKKFPKTKGNDQLNLGPGPKGIRPIWHFKMAVCGPCLQQLTLTDVQLLSERNELPPGAVRRGLAFVFLSSTMNVVSEQTARQNPNLAIKKVFSRHDLRAIISDYAEAKQLGAGAAEEWVKGLDERGKMAMADALRWSRWEDQLPLGTHLGTYLRDTDAGSFLPLQEDNSETSNADHFGSLGLPAAPPHLPRPVQAASFQNGDAHHHNSTALDTSAPHTHRQPKNAHDVQEVQRARQEDIHRRCMLLMPPLEPDVLQYMPAYHAALHIVQPMTDDAWNFLRPRIEQERDEAERQHYERTQQMALLRAAVPYDKHQSTSRAIHDAKELERQWEDSQAPLRKKLLEYADDILTAKWLRAEELEEAAVPLYAVEVLTHVYDRFHSDVDAGFTIGGVTPFLSLDALKYVFDARIRPVAERKRREMFVCSGCYAEGDTKWLAFEGLIQHYGAKHTDDFSKGNIVVHWQSAEWPSETPYLQDIMPLLKLENQKYHREFAPRRKGQQHQSHHSPQAPTNHKTSAAPAAHVPQKMLDEDLTDLCHRAVVVWHALDGVKDMPNGVRVHAVLHDIRPRYLEEYGRTFTLDKLTKMLSTEDIMADIKSAASIACGICQPDARSGAGYYERLGHKKLYNFGSLLNHWKLSHVPHMDGPWNWNLCIDLPEGDIIKSLMKSPGMNDAKLQLLADTWPAFFPMPLPVIGEVTEEPVANDLAARLVKRMTKTPGSKKKKKGGNATQHNATEQDEYDPQQPLLPSKKNGMMDMSKFDTDADRVEPLAAQLSPTMRAGAQSVAPDLLAALRTFATGPATTQPAQYAATPAPITTQTQQPTTQSAIDISAILASLQQAGGSALSAQRTTQEKAQKTPTNGYTRSDRYYADSPRLGHARTSSKQDGAIAATQPVPINHSPRRQHSQRFSAQRHEQAPSQKVQQTYVEYPPATQPRMSGIPFQPQPPMESARDQYDRPPSGYQIPAQQHNASERYMPQDQYYREPSRPMQPPVYERPAYQQYPGASTSGGQDLLAALSRNTPQHHDQQVVHQPPPQQYYDAPPVHQQPQWHAPQYAQPQYGGGQQHYQQQMYSVPQQPHYQQFSQPAPQYGAQPGLNGRVIYVDEHGRYVDQYGRRVELIPID